MGVKNHVDISQGIARSHGAHRYNNVLFTFEPPFITQLGSARLYINGGLNKCTSARELQPKHERKHMLVRQAIQE